MPWDAKYRKPDVQGIVANAIDVVVETGDSGPVTPIGINLPNDQAIREQYGSKSVALANVNEAYRRGGIDYTVTPGDTLPPNLVALKFKEEEGSYLVGALAALLNKTGKLGFVGGMEIPLIKKFEAGYVAGVHAVRPKTQVIIKYAGTTGTAFKDPTKGSELALAEYNQGADIIYHASGSTGLGVFEAAREKGKLAIGVDSDQYDEAPGQHPHLDGEARRRGGVRDHQGSWARTAGRAASRCSGWPSRAWRGSTTIATRRRSPTRHGRRWIRSGRDRRRAHRGAEPVTMLQQPA